MQYGEVSQKGWWDVRAYGRHFQSFGSANFMEMKVREEILKSRALIVNQVLLQAFLVTNNQSLNLRATTWFQVAKGVGAQPFVVVLRCEVHDFTYLSQPLAPRKGERKGLRLEDERRKRKEICL